MIFARFDVQSKALEWYSHSIVVSHRRCDPSDAASRLVFESYADGKRVDTSYEALLPEGKGRGLECTGKGHASGCGASSNGCCTLLACCLTAQRTPVTSRAFVRKTAECELSMCAL